MVVVPSEAQTHLMNRGGPHQPRGRSTGRSEARSLKRLGGREVKTLGKFRGGGVESSVRSTSADIGLTSHFRGGGPARERSGTSAQRTAAVGLTTAGPWFSSL